MCIRDRVMTCDKHKKSLSIQYVTDIQFSKNHHSLNLLEKITYSLYYEKVKENIIIILKRLTDAIISLEKQEVIL